MTVKLSYTEKKYSFKQFETLIIRRVRRVLREYRVGQEISVLEGRDAVSALTLDVIKRLRPRANIVLVKKVANGVLRPTCADYEIIDALESILKNKPLATRPGVPLLGDVTLEECNLLAKHYKLALLPERPHKLLDGLKAKDPNVLFGLLKSMKFLEGLREKEKKA